MVTSTVSGEGKTFCSINLAIILAVSNKKVLLVGLDLRRPKIHKTLGISNKIGISTYLIGKNTREEIIQNIEVNNLDIAVSGPVPPNPAELIETEEMKIFFEEAQKKYDYIIIDTPPLAIVADSLFISRYADTNLFVIRQKYSSKNVLELANDLVEKGKVKQLNVVVNDIEIGGRYGYGYNYGYSYGYGYSRGYGNDYYEGYYDEERPVKSFTDFLPFIKKNKKS
jgi:capsular exopolysaccharide synthesis family protein